jgi:UDP-N-acetyl-D-mannosaminuronic acid dehydrogenase
MGKIFSKICVIGLGYIGLPTASVLASKGYQVLGVDVFDDIVDTINQGNIHIVEPDLAAIVKKSVESGNLRAGLKPEKSDAFIIAVPTPFKTDQHNAKIPDVSYVEGATKSIVSVLEPDNLVILESTSPVGTTENVAEIICAARPELRGKIHVAYCPERVLPGQILKELTENNRIVGGIDRISAEIAKELYQSFVKGETVLTNARTAEMSKLTENSFRDVNIAFANELSLICDKLNINVWELIQLANLHPRVNILQPGPGVGGHCIAVDPWFIVDSAPNEARLIRTAREINDGKPEFVISKIKDKAREFKSPVIACLGLAFKPDIDDLRESPAVNIVRHLIMDKVGSLLVVEPYIKKLPKNLALDYEEESQIEAAATLENDCVCDIQLVDLSRALNEADIIVLLVNHRQFIDIERNKLQNKVVIDTRGVWV